MPPDNNKVNFSINVTSLLIPQRMNSFNKEAKINFAKWYYSGLYFRDMQATFPVFYPERPIPSLTCQISYIVIFGCHLPAIAILTNSLIFFPLLCTCGRC
jgi:hypothetical protein